MVKEVVNQPDGFLLQKSNVRQLGRQFKLQAQHKSTAAAAASSSLPSNILNSPATEVTTLANGLRVASEVIRHAFSRLEAHLVHTRVDMEKLQL